jgi:hypothetical protein
MDSPETQVASEAATLATPDMPAAPVAVAAPVSDGLNILPSVLTDLRASRARIGANAKPVSIAIPGYGGNLVARFRWVPANELAATSRSIMAIKNPTQQQLAAAADALVACNDEILVRVNGELESLQHGGEPVTFAEGAGLCVALGLPAPSSARECVMAVFGNDYAVADTAGKLMAWLEDTSRQVDEEHLGE